MKQTADTSFFIRVSEGITKAIEIWGDITDGKSRLVIPTVVLVELKNRFLKLGLSEKIEKLLATFEHSGRITLAPLTTDLAKKAGSLSYTYNMTNFDAVILATAIETEHKSVLTSDPFFLKPAKDGLIDVIKL